MHLTEEQFWKLTPRRYFFLYDRWQASEEAKDTRAATIACILANTNRGKNKRPYKVSDFMPKRTYLTRGKAVKKKQSVEDQIAIARAITLAFGGTDKTHLKKNKLRR